MFEHELNLPFDNHSLSRWIIIDGHIIITSIHHAIVDAKNLFYIVEKYVFLCLYDVPECKPIDFLEPMEQYLFDRYSYEPISDLDMQRRPTRPKPILSRTALRNFYVDETTLVGLKNHCSKHKIRLNSILTVITAIAYHLAAGKNEENQLKIHMMVNIRPLLGLDFQSTGVFVTVFDCIVSVGIKPLRNIWEKAIEQHQDLYRRIDNKEYIDNCKNDSDLLKLVNNNEKFSCDDVSFAFSNLGILTDDAQKSQYFNECYFGVSLIEQRWTSSILVGVTTINKRLCFTITYNRNQVSRDFIDEWVEKINLLLNTCLDEQTEV